MSHPSVRGLTRLPRPVAWVCTGGGARAAAQVGMAEILLEQGLSPDLIVGSSTGAITAAGLLDAGPDLGHLRAAWRGVGTESTLASLSTAAVRAFAPRRTGRSFREYRDQIRRGVLGDPQRPVPEHLVLVASDLVSGTAVTVRTGSVIDAAAAAAALPVIFAPVPTGDLLLIDGGLTAAAPLDQALAAGAASVILLDTGASAAAADAVAAMRWWQIAGIAYGHQIRGQLGPALVRVAEQIPVVTLSTDAGGQLDFTQPDEHFSAGRTAASSALASGIGRAVTGSPGVFGIPSGFEQDSRILATAGDPTDEPARGPQ